MWWQSEEKKCGADLSKYCITYSQQKFHFFIPMTFVQLIFIKTKQQGIPRKVPLLFFKVKISTRSEYIYLSIIFLKSSLMFYLWTIVCFVYWKDLFLSLNSSRCMHFGKLWDGNQYLCRIYEKPFSDGNHYTDL